MYGGISMPDKAKLSIPEEKCWRDFTARFSFTMFLPSSADTASKFLSQNEVFIAKYPWTGEPNLPHRQYLNSYLITLNKTGADAQCSHSFSRLAEHQNTIWQTTLCKFQFVATHDNQWKMFGEIWLDVFTKSTCPLRRIKKKHHFRTKEFGYKILEIYNLIICWSMSAGSEIYTPWS